MRTGCWTDNILDGLQGLCKAISQWGKDPLWIFLEACRPHYFWKMRLLRMQPGLKEGKGSVLGANSQLPPSELWFHLPNFFSSSTFPPSFSHSNQSTAAINVTQHAAVNSSVQFCRTSENIPRIWLSADETCLNYPHYLPLHIPYALFVFLMLGGGGWIVTKKKKNLQIEERRTSSQKYIHNCKSG